MRKTLRLAMGAAVLAALSGYAVATNYTLWINGRSNSATPGNHADFRYWGPATTAAGVNKKSVNWDGYNSIANTNARVRDALDCYCTGNNWCYIAAHSAGNLQIGYSLALFGTSTRSIKTRSHCAYSTVGSDNTDMSWSVIIPAAVWPGRTCTCGRCLWTRSASPISTFPPAESHWNRSSAS